MNRVRSLIDSYSFGEVTVEGKRYKSDVIIHARKVIEGWWRREGHRLSIEDLGEILKLGPEVLIVGTGYRGLMKVPEETRLYIESQGVELIVEDTRKACETYNSVSSSKRAVAALHLTC